MKVSELIAALQSLPPDLPVMTPGFDESGYSDICYPHIVRLVSASFNAGPERRTFLATIGSVRHYYEYDEASAFDVVLIDFDA